MANRPNKEKSESTLEAERLERAIRATNDGVWEWNIQTNEVWYSPTLMRMIGRNPDKEAPNLQHWLDHIHPDDKKLIEAGMNAHFEHEEKYDIIYRGLGPSGQYEWLLTRGDTIKDENGRPLLMSGTLTNINEKKILEQQLADKTHFLNAVLEKSLCGIYIFDFNEKRNIYINEQFTNITGYSLKTLNKAQQRKSISLFHKEDEKRVSQHLKNVFDNRIEQGESIDYRFRHANGHWIWCYSRDSIYKYDSSGVPQQLIGTFFDISDIKIAEKTLEESNASLERFAYSASHDLQEPLRKISVFSDSLQERLQGKIDDADALYELDRIANAACRMRDMINSLLELSRYSRQKPKKKLVALRKVLNTVKEDLANLTEESKASITLLNEENIFIDKSSFQHVLQNLIVNSIRYARPDIPAEISINCKHDESQVTLTVKDNGRGFSKKSSSTIFDPFKRLVGRNTPGSGMGLAICQQIVKAHGGNISADGHSQPGAVFTITLPSHDGL